MTRRFLGRFMGGISKYTCLLFVKLTNGREPVLLGPDSLQLSSLQAGMLQYCN